MGLIFNLFVETGGNEAGNEKLRAYFLSIGKLETPSGAYEMKIGSVENNIGITVYVTETGYRGFESSEMATQVGFGFYELLKAAPEFRYAMVGVEAGEWADGQNISDHDFDGYLPSHGLVVNNELRIMTDKQLVPFKEGYSWIPYKGEKTE